MNDNKVHFVTVETSSLDEYSQRELNAYRNIGTLREFRRLKHEEMNRKERRQRFMRNLHTLIAGSLIIFITEAIFFLLLIYT